MSTDYLGLLKEQFNNRISYRVKRPGIIQLVAPFYHEDGDMLDIFLTQSNEGTIRVCDYGMTIQHLSYSYDIDTPRKEQILDRILTENQLSEENGNIFIDTPPDGLYPAILQFAQTVGKVSNMRMFGREVIRSLFLEQLIEFVETGLAQFRPQFKVHPLAQRDELEVDIQLTAGRRPIYLFGIRDTAKARLTTISCLEFQKARLPFMSVVVHEDFSSMPKKDIALLTSAADKQFVTLDNFRENGLSFFEREAAN